MKQRHLLGGIHRLFATFGAVFSVAILVSAYSGGAAFAAGASANTRMTLFNSAAQEFGVPVSVLVALSYNETHLQSGANASIDGGFGLMDLRAQVTTVVSGKDGKTMTVPTSAQQTANDTLDQAAALLHEPASTLKSDDGQNIRGAAAVLAQDAKQLNGGTLPTNPADWYSAIAKFSGSSDNQTASTFADDVFSVMKNGVNLTTPDGQAISLPAISNLQPNKSTFSALDLKTVPNNVTPPTGQKAECPSTLNCRFVPAAYAQDDPNDPTNYGNYDPANRPHDMAIKYIFIHDTEGSYDSAINHFQDPTAYDSAQYVVRSSDGAVTQMVRNEDVSWGVYDWYDNMHGINIENEGFAADGASWYTPAMYQTDATLVRYLAAKYHIPLDRAHILGHDNISVLNQANFPNQHWDPGPYWNWNYFMDLVQGKTMAQASADITQADMALSGSLKKGDVAIIDPHFATNQPTVTDCQTGACVTLPPQGTSFVYLHTQLSNDSPLLYDQNVFGSGGSSTTGTTQDNDWGDKAPSGFQYVVADVRGNWTAIWFAGQKAWFYNPSGTGRTATKSTSLTITPKPGMSSIAVYGAALPEASAYPSDIPVEQFNSLYTIPAGQSYTTTGENLPTDYYYDATINYSLPDDHAIVHGNTKYYQIFINHRMAYVKASDVVVK